MGNCLYVCPWVQADCTLYLKAWDQSLTPKNILLFQAPIAGLPQILLPLPTTTLAALTTAPLLYNEEEGVGSGKPPDLPETKTLCPDLKTLPSTASQATKPPRTEGRQEHTTFSSVLAEAMMCMQEGQDLALAHQKVQTTLTVDVLMGEGNFTSPTQQLALPDDQLQTLGGIVLQAWNRVPARGSASIAGFASIHQGPAREMLLKQLAFENANEDCKPFAKHPSEEHSLIPRSCFRSTAEG